MWRNFLLIKFTIHAIFQELLTVCFHPDPAPRFDSILVARDGRLGLVSFKKKPFLCRQFNESVMNWRQEWWLVSGQNSREKNNHIRLFSFRISVIHPAPRRCCPPEGTMSYKTQREWTNVRPNKRTSFRPKRPSKQTNVLPSHSITFLQ